MSVIPFPLKRSNLGSGIIHVYGDRIDGYRVSHEGPSGGSWGNQRRYADPGDAISAAYAMNRDDYDGDCEVYVSDGVVDDANAGVGSIDVPTRGDF